MNRIMEKIPKGKKNAIPVKVLGDALGISNKSTVRGIVQGLRGNGEIICSCPGGYFIPETREELREYVDRMERQARGTFRGIKAAREMLRRFEGQETLDL